MKIMMFLITTLLLAGQFASDLTAFSSYEEIFQRGVKAYEEQNYELALQSFLDLEEEGVVNAELFYNIGNTYYRLDELGYAILYYKKGLKLRPDNNLLKSNLNYLLSLTQDRQIVEESNPFLNLINKLVHLLPINTLFIITLINFALIVLIINIIIIYFRKRDKSIPFFILILLSLCFILVASVAYYRYHEIHDDSEAVLIASSTNGYSGPSEEYTNLFRIHEGMIFEVNTTTGGWSQITLPTGISGWIKNDSFLRVALDL